jgi:hypothetical protein
MISRRATLRRTLRRTLPSLVRTAVDGTLR